ncbi:MAG TPA: sugar ABC transporter permease [Ktedonobacteraceae bacterium]|jgi:ABC-type sugar transport system permease subunit|nr:sugar ABC transporter permease [Ktedonobacteraceae bacterium]
MATQTVDTPSKTTPGLRPRAKTNVSLLPYFLVLPTALLILIIAIYPMIDSVYLSLLDNPLLLRPNFVGFANYVRILGDPAFTSAISTTVIFTIISVALETVFGLGVALLINKTFPGRGLVRAAILVPWAYPTVVSAQMWLLMYNDQTGIITYLLQLVHLLKPGDTLIGSTNGVIIAALVTDIWKTTPFMALLLLAGLQVIPSELYEAAGVDGSTRWQQFTRITLPLLRGSLIIALLFRSLDAIRTFDLFYVFGQRAVPSMASYAQLKMFGGTPLDFAPGIAASVIVFLFGLVISLIFVGMMRANRS